MATTRKKKEPETEVFYTGESAMKHLKEGMYIVPLRDGFGGLSGKAPGEGDYYYSIKDQVCRIYLVNPVSYYVQLHGPWLNSRTPRYMYFCSPDEKFPSIAGGMRLDGENVPLYRLATEEETAGFEEALTAAIKKQFLEQPKKMYFFQTGTDPEFFALGKEGAVIPAFNFLPSVKERVSNEPFWDGFQAEINPAAVSCLQSLADYIRSNLASLNSALQKHSPGAKLVAKSVVDVNAGLLQTLPDEFVELGCSPSMNIYPDVEAIKVDDPRQLLYRSAGCHIHFGTGRPEEDALKQGIKCLDAVAAVAMVSLFRDMEDPRRRVLYGRAGEYRLPVHGVEYRTPPAEVMSHPVLYHLCFDLMRQAYCLGALMKMRDEWKASDEEVRAVVDSCDVKGAEKILKRNKKLLLALYSGVTGSENAKKNFETLVFTGAKNWLPLDDVRKTWGLDGTSLGAYHGSEMSTSSLVKQSPVAAARL